VVGDGLDAERRLEVRGDPRRGRARAGVDDRGRSKPVVTRTGSRKRRRAAMSLATCGVAVAVEATIARASSRRAASARRK
jgi:hypothetical protein